MRFSLSPFLLLALAPFCNAFMSPRLYLLRSRSNTRMAPLCESQGPPGFPNVIIYPGDGWGLSKPEPKQSLVENGSAGSAAPWILNLIEFFHWVSFPIGFGVFWTIFSNIDKLGAKIDPTSPTSAAFFLLFAHVCQVFGGGTSGNMMHQYEGWQVTEFRNPLRAEVAGSAQPDYNDAWLRAVAYQMLFSFQTLGVLFTWLAVFGLTPTLSKPLIVLTGLVITLAPQLPRCTTVFPDVMERVGLGLPELWSRLTNGNRPVFPLSIYLFGTFLVNAVLATSAYQDPNMFGGINWTGVPILESLPGSISSIIPIILIIFGGIYEGIGAETSFNQWDHFIAIVALDAGLLLHIPYYLRLIA